MTKKFALLAFSVIGLSNVAMADIIPEKGTTNRTGDLPNIENLVQQQQNAKAAAPKHTDDYRGSNTPLPPIKTVTFKGPTVLSQDDLNAIARPYLNRPITDNDVAQLKMQSLMNILNAVIRWSKLPRLPRIWPQPAI